MKVYDITHSIKVGIPVWPGDQIFEHNKTMTIPDGYSCNVSSVTMSLHTGTHADAHYHYDNEGKSMTEHELERYMGHCQVIDVSQTEGPMINIKDLSEDIASPRILFKTINHLDTHWDEHFKGLSPELVDYLHHQGVCLIGTDAPSVDLYQSKALPTHHKLLQYDIYNLESLCLQEIIPGHYRLLALPMKLENADASPVRAILIQD